MALAALRSRFRRHAGMACLVLCAVNWAWSYWPGGWGITLAAVHIEWNRFPRHKAFCRGVYSEAGTLCFANLVEDGRIFCAPSRFWRPEPPPPPLRVTAVYETGWEFAVRSPWDNGHRDFIRSAPVFGISYQPESNRFAFLGFGGEWSPASYARVTERGVWVPWWFLTTVFAFGPARRAWRRVGGPLFGRVRTAWCHAPGTCRRCGYDLRATPERCPECGTHVKPVAAEARPHAGGI